MVQYTYKQIQGIKMENFKTKAKLFKKIATVSASADIKKDKKVNFGARGRTVKYSYASYSNIMNIVNPLLVENGLAISHKTTLLDNNTYLLTTYVVDTDSGEYIESDKVFTINSNQQTNGSNETYLKRYNVALLLNLSVDEDDDATVSTLSVTDNQNNNYNNYNNQGVEVVQRPPIVYVTKEQGEEVKNLLGEALAGVLEFFKVKSVTSLTIQQYGAIKRKYAKKGNK